MIVNVGSHQQSQAQRLSSPGSRPNVRDRARRLLTLHILRMPPFSAFAGVFYVGQESHRIRFVTESALTVVLAALVAVQAYVYRKQWDIMQNQAESMDKSVVCGLRAYVGIHSVEIDLTVKRLVIQIENIGKVPASEVKVAVEMEVAIAKGCATDAYKRCKWSSPEAINILRLPLAYDFGHTKLFPGNLKIKIMVPLNRYFTDGEISWIRQGDARLVIRGNINSEDGFNRDKNSPFAFRYSKAADATFPIRFCRQPQRVNGSTTPIRIRIIGNFQSRVVRPRSWQHTNGALPRRAAARKGLAISARIPGIFHSGKTRSLSDA